MAGIAVVVSWGGQDVTQARVERMLGCIAHRGTERRWVSAGDGAALGAVWRGEGQSSPERCPCGEQRVGLCGVADVRLDNREELAAGLSPGASPPPPDVELLILGYERWGNRLAERLVGDFAFVIWDASRQRLYAARDPFGVKPLFYQVGSSGLSLASEVEQLVSPTGAGPALDERVLLEYLRNDHRQPRATFFRDVSRVLPGHWLLAGPGGIHEGRYWQPPRRLRWLPRRQDYFREFRRLFRSAVKARLDPAAPVVAQLSGGLDSSAIVCTADEIYRYDPVRPPLYTASAVYPGLDCDETRYLDAVARQVRFAAHRWDGTETRALDPGEEPVVGHPWGGSAADNLEGDQCLARRVGARVILSGFGGDQLLFEHGVFRDLAADGRWLRLLQQTVLVRFYSSQSGRYFLGDALRGSLPAIVRRAYRRWRPRRSPEPPPWLNAALHDQWLEAAAEPANVRSRASHTQQATWTWLTRPQLWWSIELRALAAARQGLEVRFPFLDRRLADFVLAVPYEVRLPGGRMKNLLRHALRDVLPAAVARRRRVTTFESAARLDYYRQRAPLRALFGGGRWLAEPFLDRRGVQRYFEDVDAQVARGRTPCGAIGTLLDIAQLELWLRGLHNRGVLPFQGA